MIFYFQILVLHIYLLLFWKMSMGIHVIHCSPCKTPCLGSIGLDDVISELCYKATILQRNYRKMTILWSFSYNSFVSIHCEKSYNMTITFQ